METRPVILAPSILSADFLTLGEQIAQVENAGADWLHVDVMDGHFVPNLTMGAFIVKTCHRATHLPLDVHLMVNDPEKFLQPFAEAGADSLTIHVEACTDAAKVLAAIRALGCQAGISLKPETPLERIFPLIDQVDMILVMCVYPGFSGQTYLPGSSGRIARLRQALDERGSKAWLEVDGGINSSTLPQARRAGANAFVAASAVFLHPDGIEAGMLALQAALD